MDSAPGFFPPVRPISAQELATALDLPLVGPSGQHPATLSDAARGDPITGVAPIEDAGRGHLSFLDNPKYVGFLARTGASLVVLSPKYADQLPDAVWGLLSNQPYRDFARAASMLVPQAVKLRGASLESGISTASFVHPEASLENGVTIEAGAVIGAHAAIGAGTTICAGAIISHHCQVGRDSYIGMRASIQHALIGNKVILHSGVAVGQDGFGFAMGPQGHLKVPQLGRVVIQDDVEIGAGTCIDRGTTRDTVIGEGTRIDNLVQIGHNVQIGRHCIIVAQVGIAGSSVLEDFVAIGGQVGIAGHVRIGMGAQIAAAANVKDDVPPGQRWAGTPAKPARAFFRELTAVKKLAERSSS